MSKPQLPAQELVREPTDEGYLEREGVRLHWLEWAPSGTSEPPAFLLLHGLSSNARYWERVARRMTNRRLVALDQRSHGLSDAPPSGYGMDVLAADAGHAIRELGLDLPVVVGHSWGGTVALEVGARQAELVSGVAVMDGPIASMSERITWEDASRMMQPPLPRYRSLEEAFEAKRPPRRVGGERHRHASVERGGRQAGARDPSGCGHPLV